MSWVDILKLQPHGKLRPFRESGNEGNLTAEFSAKIDSLPESENPQKEHYKKEKVMEFDRLNNTEKKHILENDAMFDQFMLDFDPVTNRLRQGKQPQHLTPFKYAYQEKMT